MLTTIEREHAQTCFCMRFSFVNNVHMFAFMLFFWQEVNKKPTDPLCSWSNNKCFSVYIYKWIFARHAHKQVYSNCLVLASKYVAVVLTESARLLIHITGLFVKHRTTVIVRELQCNSPEETRRVPPYYENYGFVITSGSTAL